MITQNTHDYTNTLQEEKKKKNLTIFFLIFQNIESGMQSGGLLFFIDSPSQAKKCEILSSMRSVYKSRAHFFILRKKCTHFGHKNITRCLASTRIYVKQNWEVSTFLVTFDIGESENWSLFFITKIIKVSASSYELNEIYCVFIMVLPHICFPIILKCKIVWRFIFCGAIIFIFVPFFVFNSCVK